MKKIILLIMLFTSISVMSQVCELTVIFSEYIETCDRSTSPSTSCVNVGVGLMHGSTTIALKIYDQSTRVETSIGIPPFPENAIYEFCGYLEGATLEISAFDTSNPDCQSSIFYHTISGCSNLDNDNDGFTADVDCNDNDPNINPEATEICDGKDNNCDGNIDEGFAQNTYYWDGDLDGYGGTSTKIDCQGGARFILTGGDCNDSDPLINPGVAEICGDGIDNNCDGNIDEDCDCPDADGDTVCDADDICPGFDDLADADGDNIPDGCDACPSDPLKTEPGACGCGVADIDTDSDGVLDCNDNEINSPCPNNVDASGVSVDTDSDNTPDCLDNCPNDPLKTEAGTCGCGVADVDTDSDGVLDCNDNEINSPCPNNVDANGVSIDSDSDSTPDCLDNCPNDPLKTEVGACGCGFVDTDTDADSIPDCNDACPNDPTNTCNDCPDADSDTVCDADDICPGFDDLADADGDNIPDGCDACPNDPLKTEPGTCGCGVEDTDTDSDGVLDCNDNEINSPCPDNIDANGVSIDSDSDSTPDCLDNCPNDSLKTEPGACGCGFVDTDTDADGIPDCNDICPGFNDLLDSDRDGTPDCLDLCPNDRNKTEPGLCGCGTSDADKDGDTVPDCLDVCPRGPDTDTDRDGVPDCIDICAGQDDKIDTDGDGLPDCVDSCPNDATNTCSGNTCRAGLFEICHVKKNGDRTTLCVTPDQWARHKTHPGDALGSCTPAAAKVALDSKTTAEVNEQLNIYPNPLKTNGLWIKFSARQNSKKFTAIIYDLNGRVLAQKVFESNYKTDRYFWDFNNESWDVGIFMLKIEDGTKTYFRRLLKLKN
ncbi:T9SS type A sorting domain-containing protein [Flavobacteriaceae bacterium LMO-SS05]